MNDYKINLVVNTYFNVLMSKGISEKNIKNTYQKDGFVYIILLDDTIIKEKIQKWDITF